MQKRSILSGLVFTISVAYLIFQSASCDSSRSEQEQVVQTINEELRKDSLQINEAQNNFYRVLSGLDFADGQIDSAGMQEYNDQWAQMKSRLLDSISRWKATNIPMACQQTQFLFYPFSGPDFVIPNTLFPDVERMVMFGLELPGLDISSSGTEGASRLLPQMRNSLRDYFGKSYFITKHMINDLRTDSLNGVTPLIASFIVRSGFSIVSIRNFVLDSSGNKQYTENKESLGASNQSVKGVEICYSSDKISKRQIDYIAFNAEDANLDKQPEIESFLSKNVPDETTTYIKSASYLLHYASFSRVRDFCLRKSRYLLQDDTGIPYKYLATNWTCNIFGSYIKPIADFSGVYQFDLDSLYRANQVDKKLPFSMGYHYFTGKQNLMFASKK